MSSTDCFITRAALSLNEHYTDTGGFSDHVFAMCRLLGFRFAPRIRDLKEKRLYVLPGMIVPLELASLAAGAINLRVISHHWFELGCWGATEQNAELRICSVAPQHPVEWDYFFPK